jgi:cobalt-zinc-cadmium efflux system outer membrane protein
MLSLAAAAGLAAQVPPEGAQPARLTLDGAVEEAIRNNLDLMAERQSVPLAKAREITAALRPNPVVMFTYDYQDWLRRGLNSSNSAGPTEWSPQVTYTLETAGKRSRRVEVAKLATSAAELRLLDAVRQLAFQVRQASVEYLLAKENLALARANLKVFTDILKVNEAKVQAGELAGVELTRTRVARQQLDNAILQAQLRLTTASNNLRQLLGRSPSEPDFELEGSLRDDAVVLLPEELRAQALEQRPDLLALRKDSERAKADTRLQIANSRPDVTVGMMYHAQLGYSNGRTFGTFASVPLPVHDRNQGEIARAQREMAQTRLRTEALERAIATEVENAWQQYATARSLLDRIRGRLLNEAKQVRDITEFSYRRGEASLLEFLDAQRAYNDAVQSYNDARADYMRSLYLIDAVTGKPVMP